jgi:hypothetical protein
VREERDVHDANGRSRIEGTEYGQFISLDVVWVERPEIRAGLRRGRQEHQDCE